MLTRNRHARGMVALCVGVIAAAGLTACGSGSSAGSSASSNPQTLLKQTFSNAHTVTSGVLQFALTVTPTGSSAISTPVSLRLGGPFQSRGAKQSPESNFTVTASGLGRSASFGVVSTASAAYMRLDGVAYKLPASDFHKIQSSLASSSSTGSAPGLSSLGINPEHWVTNPKIVGTETVDGSKTEHLRAGVDVSALIKDINVLLAKQKTTTTKTGIPSQISAAEARKVAGAIHNPTVDVWTGEQDTTLRRLILAATIPVTGKTSSELGGMSSAALNLTLDYTQLNQSQTIAAPAQPHSYQQLQAKLNSLGEQLQGALGTTTGSTGSSSSGASSAKVSKYSKCINGAHGKVTKMQKCASLLNGSGG